MNSLILKVSARWIVPLMLLFSLYLLFRGHNLPGGGFIGGLTAGVALVLHAFAGNTGNTLQQFRLNPLVLISLGLLLALVSGLWGMAFGEGLFHGLWLPWDLHVLPKIGTPLFFDIGVYMVVLGCITLISFRLID